MTSQNHCVKSTFTNNITEQILTITQQYTGQLKLEQYIETNKFHLNDNLPLLTAQTAHNLTTREWKIVNKIFQTASLH